jgi:diguanylate cyclase
LIAIIGKISNVALSLCAGVSAFIWTLLAFLLLREIDQQLVASLVTGVLAIMVVWIACERPNGRHARAVTALVDRLLAVRTGDLSSPSPQALREEMPTLASAVDGLFDQVRSNLENVHAMAMYDPVTSLPNRVHFKREAERILKARAAGGRLALLFIDLDGFKEVNDSFGHAQGDQTLTLVANRLRASVKQEAELLIQPLIARLAGDEFTLLFPSLRARGDAERIAGHLLDALCEPFEIGDQRIKMGASIGIALCPAHGTDLTALMRAADIAMYHAKESGRSQVCVFDKDLATTFEEKARLERALRQAVDAGQFELTFHPQLCVRSGAIVAGEALVRWNHPTYGGRMADGFVRLAEENCLVAEIGDWVTDEATHTLARWHAAGMEQRLTVNVSPRQLERTDFFARLRDSLGRSGAPPAMLELELSETLAMRCSDEAMEEIASLRANGVSITIDEFGSGYSNLARMKDMPIDRVKLAAALIREIDHCESARTIVSSVIHLIHGLGAQAVGEGVERSEQFEVLRAIGCDLVQGRAFAEPMAEADFIRWVAERGGEQRQALIA